MDFVDAIKTCFVKYIDFKGRAPRSEFWYYELFLSIVYLAAIALYRPLYYPLLIVTTIPSLAVCARRLHDTDRSGWWQLLVLVPIVGWVVLFVWQCRASDAYANRFGDPPGSGLAGTISPG